MSSAAPTDARRFIAASWFEAIDDSTRWAIWEAVRPATAPAGVALIDEGRINGHLWFIEDGAVAVERSRPGQPAEVLASLSGPAVYGTTTFFRATLSTITLRATAAVQGWTLDRAAYEQLRIDRPAAAEALLLLVVRVLSDRFDQMDRHIAGLLADHHRNGDQPRVNEWAEFRNRLFEEPAT